MDDERRQQLEQMLNEIETAISELVQNKVASYKLGERSYTFYSIGELIKLREQILSELNYNFETYLGTASIEGDL
mgnify:CR=1 FL=1